MHHTIKEIYIHGIDGTDVWVLVQAKQLNDDQYEILDHAIYKNIGVLFECYPGDLVEVGAQTVLDGTKRSVAQKLISKGEWPDRKYLDLLYKATLGKLNIDKQTADFFRIEIERVKKEHVAGKTFYPTLLETVHNLDILNNEG